MSELYRMIPAVDVVLDDDRMQVIPRALAVWMIREVIAELRREIGRGKVTEVGDLVPDILDRAHRLLGGRIRPGSQRHWRDSSHELGAFALGTAGC